MAVASAEWPSGKGREADWRTRKSATEKRTANDERAGKTKLGESEVSLDRWENKAETWTIWGAAGRERHKNRQRLAVNKEIG